MRARAVEVVLALLAGALVVGGIVALTANRADTPSEPNRYPDPTVASDDAAPVDPGPLIDAWERALSATFALDGTRRREENGEVTSLERVRRSQRGDRRLDQTGRYSVVVADGQERSCEPMDATQVGCAPPLAAPSPAQQLAAIRAQLEPTEVGLDPDYLVYDNAGDADDDQACWTVIATEPRPLANWGQVTQFCFDADTGALAYRHTSSGNEREIFQASSVRAEVTEADLTPTTG